MKRFIILVLAIIIILQVNALTIKKTELLGNPTAYTLSNGQLDIALYGSTAIKLSEDRVPFSYNMAVSYGILDMMDITVNMYTIKDFALHFQYNIMKESEALPALSAGVRNITYRKYIDEGGGGSDPSATGYYDYSWNERAADMLSVYLIASKDFGSAGKFSVGIGRGEFVGYSRGRFLSTAAFFNETQLTDGITTDLMFGFFGGVEVPIIDNLSFLADVDGRDVNAGLRFHNDVLSVDAALTHAELFTSNDPNQRPRIDASVNYIFNLQSEKPQHGYLVVNILDNSSGKNISGLIDFENIDAGPYKLSSGRVKMKLKPGKYKIKVDADNYKWQKRVFSVSGNATTELNVRLQKKDDKKAKAREEAIALVKDARDDLNEGNIKSALDKLTEARDILPDDPTILAYYRKAIKERNDAIAKHRENAIAYENKDWYKSARNEWNAILVLDRNNAEAKRKYSEMQAKIDAANKPAPKPQPKPQPKKNPDELYDEGYQHFLNGEYAEAVKKFEEVLELEPGNRKAERYLKKAKSRM